MSDSEKKLDEVLDTVDASRRLFLRKVVLTTAFTAPIVASFAVDGMVISSAMAGVVPNCSNCS